MLHRIDAPFGLHVKALMLLVSDAWAQMYHRHVFSIDPSLPRYYCVGRSSGSVPTSEPHADNIGNIMLIILLKYSGTRAALLPCQIHRVPSWPLKRLPFAATEARLGSDPCLSRYLQRNSSRRSSETFTSGHHHKKGETPRVGVLRGTKGKTSRALRPHRIGAVFILPCEGRMELV